MFSFLTGNIVKYLVIALVLFSLVGYGVYSTYKWGQTVERQDRIEQQLQDIRDTSDSVKKGLNEVRKANPTGDSDISRNRLRDRNKNR